MFLYANDAGRRCTGGCTTLHAVRACCTVCNTQAAHSCEAMAKWVSFDADIRNSLKRQLFFGSCSERMPKSIGRIFHSQRSQEMPLLGFQQEENRTKSKASTSFLEEALPLDGLLGNLFSHNHAQYGSSRYTQTNAHKHTDRLIKVHGAYTGLRPIGVIKTVANSKG